MVRKGYYFHCRRCGYSTNNARSPNPKQCTACKQYNWKIPARGR